MFVDNPFWLAIVVSGVISAVLMLALWLGLDRALARRLVLAAVVPAVAVAVPAAIGLPETARGGVGAALLMLVLGGVCGAILDFSRISERICLSVAGVFLLLGGWLVLAAPVTGIVFHPMGIQIPAWGGYLLVGASFLWVTRPDFSADDLDDAPVKGKKSKSAKKKTAKTAPAKKVPLDTAIKPAPVAVFMTLAIGQGIIAAQFGLRDHVVFQAALSIALFVALVSEKAVPQYRAAVWLAVASALMTSAAGVMIEMPAASFAVMVLLLVVSAGAAASRVVGCLGSVSGPQAVLVVPVVRVAVLALPVVVAALVAYVGARMMAGLH